MKKDFFVESAFGEIYEKTLFEDDIREFKRLTEQARNTDPKKILTAENPVRMFNQVDIERESTQAVNSHYKLSGDFGNSFSNYFSGKIFGDMWKEWLPMGVSRIDEADKVRDTVQIDNSLSNTRSPFNMNFRRVQRVNPVQNAAGVVISISGNRANNDSMQSNTSLSNIDMDLFAAD